jgi:Domain of unknown function (DUF4410)
MGLGFRMTYRSESPTKLIRFSPRRGVLLSGLCLALVLGCGRTTITPVSLSNPEPPLAPAGTGYYTKSRLAQPNRILVYDFAVSADDVSLDRAVGARLLQRLEGASQTEEQLKIGRALAQALSIELVAAIQKFGLPAERAGDAPIGTDNDLAIEGQFVSIDEGNRLRRMVIGLGAGATEVKTQVQLYAVTPENRRLLEEFEVTAQSSRKPGMAETMGAGAAVTGAEAVAVGAGVGVASEYGATVEADGRRTAKAVAEKLSKFFASEGWITTKATE